MNPPKCKVCGWEHWENAPHYTGMTFRGLTGPAIAASVIPAVPRMPRIPVSNTPPMPQAEEDHEEWWLWGKEYIDLDCKNCGRHRVQTGCDAPDGSTHVVCEKCGWDQDKNCYAVELVFPAPAANPKRPRGRPISPEPKSPRAEYQRELMRKRRAAAKEAKP